MSSPALRMNAEEIWESNRQAELLWSTWASRHPAGELVQYEGLIAAWCRQRWAFMNATIVTSPVANASDLENRVRTAVEHAQARPYAWMLMCCRQWLPDMPGEVFSRFGLTQIMSMTGMVADDVAPAAGSPIGVELRRVTDADTRNAVADLNAVAYDVPLEWGRELIPIPAIWGDDAFGCVGYVDGKAVTTASTLIVDGIRYVGLVATLPEYRHRGYAEVVMRHSLAMAEAATGIRRTVLHASAMGRPNYERMGYRAVADFDLYAPAH